MEIELLNAGHLVDHKELMLEACEHSPDSFTSTRAERECKTDS